MRGPSVPGRVPVRGVTSTRSRSLHAPASRRPAGVVSLAHQRDPSESGTCDGDLQQQRTHTQNMTRILPLPETGRSGAAGTSPPRSVFARANTGKLRAPCCSSHKLAFEIWKLPRERGGVGESYLLQSGHLFCIPVSRLRDITSAILGEIQGCICPRPHSIMRGCPSRVPSGDNRICAREIGQQAAKKAQRSAFLCGHSSHEFDTCPSRPFLRNRLDQVKSSLLSPASRIQAQRCCSTPPTSLAVFPYMLGVLTVPGC